MGGDRPALVLRLADRRGLLTYLTHKGVFVNAGHHFLQDAIVEHAARSEAAAPPYSIAAELLRQRRAEA